MNTNQFSLANRKQLADMLADKYEGLRYKARQRFATRNDELRNSLIKEFAGKKGALGVYDEIEAATAHLTVLKVKLSGLGFELKYSGDLDLNTDGENLFGKSIDTRIEKEIGKRADIDARFDSAQIAMMTVASLEDAEKLLKSVTSI